MCGARSSRPAAAQLRTPPRSSRPRQLLRQAKRPLVVLGGGAQHAGASARAVIEKIGALAVTTINGKGILPPDHPLSLGSTLPQPPVLEELTHADVVLAVGTELGETDTLLFDSRLRLGGKVIRVDIDPEQLTRNVLAEVAILSDADLALRALDRELQNHKTDGAAVTARAKALRAQLQGLLHRAAARPSALHDGGPAGAAGRDRGRRLPRSPCTAPTCSTSRSGRAPSSIPAPATAPSAMPCRPRSAPSWPSASSRWSR